MASMDKIFSACEKRVAALEASSNPLSKGVAWIGGDIVPLHEARIPLLDQGFLRSDLTYDVPAVWVGHYFRLDDHLDRFELSCSKLRLKLPVPKQEIKTILIDMTAKSGIRDAFVELIVTRGLRSLYEGKPEELQNSLYMFIKPYLWVMPPEVQRTGGSAFIARTVRRIPPGAVDPTVKNLQWGDFSRGIMEGQDRGAKYPFLTDGDGNLTEGSGFNIVLVKDGKVYTPDRGVLHGVTRRSVMDVARKNGIELRYEVIPVEMAYQADEIFMCTTAGGIMPVTKLDGQPVKDGKIGPITKKIWDDYWAMHYEPDFIIKIAYGEKSKL